MPLNSIAHESAHQDTSLPIVDFLRTYYRLDDPRYKKKRRDKPKAGQDTIDCFAPVFKQQLVALLAEHGHDYTQHEKVITDKLGNLNGLANGELTDNGKARKPKGWMLLKPLNPASTDIENACPTEEPEQPSKASPPPQKTDKPVILPTDLAQLEMPIQDTDSTHLNAVPEAQAGELNVDIPESVSRLEAIVEAISKEEVEEPSAVKPPPPPAPYSPVIQAALEYALSGMTVCALSDYDDPRQNGKGAKFPRIYDHLTQKRLSFVEMKTRDAASIINMFTRWPKANLAICGGKMANGENLLIIDVDMKDGKDGEASLAKLESLLCELPATRVHRTPSGNGRHLFFTYPSGIEIGSSTAGLAATIGVDADQLGIDIKAHNGYVVAPPSTFHGVSYTVESALSLAALPDAWIKALTEKVTAKPNNASTVIDKASSNAHRARVPLPNDLLQMLKDTRFAGVMLRPPWLAFIGACLRHYEHPELIALLEAWSKRNYDKFDQADFDARVREGLYGDLGRETTEEEDARNLIADAYYSQVKAPDKVMSSVATANKAAAEAKRASLAEVVLSGRVSVNDRQAEYLEVRHKPNAADRKNAGKALVKVCITGKNADVIAYVDKHVAHMDVDKIHNPMVIGGEVNELNLVYWAARNLTYWALQQTNPLVDCRVADSDIEHWSKEVEHILLSEKGFKSVPEAYARTIKQAIEKASCVFNIPSAAKDAEYKAIAAELATQPLPSDSVIGWKKDQFTPENIAKLKAPHLERMAAVGMTWEEETDAYFMVFTHEPSFDRGVINDRLTAFIGLLNTTQAMAIRMGKSRLMRPTERGHKWLVRKDILESVEKYTIQTGFRKRGKDYEPIYMNQLDAWRLHAKSLSFGDVVFEPHRIDEQPVLPVGTYNMYTGFTVNPVKAQTAETEDGLKLILNHIEHVLCSGVVELTEFNLNWLAWKLQNPHLLPQTAIVYRGLKGSGKSILGSFMCKLYGVHAMAIGGAAALVSEFNEHLEDKLFICVNEAKFIKEDADIKVKVTDETLFINGKFEKGASVKNRLQIMMTSNEDAVIVASDDERRYCVCDVAPTYVKNTAYFKPLIAAMNNIKVQSAFLYEMLNRDVSSFEPNIAPESDGLKQQREATLPSVERFLVDAVIRGDFPSNGGIPPQWERREPTSKLFDCYLHYCHMNHVIPSRIKSLTTFSLTLRRFFEKWRTKTERGFCLESVEATRKKLETELKINIVD